MHGHDKVNIGARGRGGQIFIHYSFILMYLQKYYINGLPKPTRLHENFFIFFSIF